MSSTSGNSTEDRSQILMNVAITFTVLETVFVSLYFTSRLKSKTANGLDTYLMLPAFLFCMGDIILGMLYVTKGGFGRHVDTLTLDTIIYALKFQAALGFVNPGAITLPKLAILGLYLRIFTTRTYRYMAYGIAGVLISNWIASWVTELTMCKPIAYQWNRFIPGGSCLEYQWIFTWFSIPNLVTDVAMLILPLPVIWGLHTSLVQKIGLTITFLTGSFGIVTAAFRFSEFIKLNTNTATAEDLTWYGVDLIIWTMVEPGVYLIAACLPSLRPLFKPAFKGVSFRSLRTRFLAYGSSNANADGSGNIYLAERSIGGNAPGAGSYSGFQKLHDPMSRPSLSDGNDQKGLVSCYREDDGPEIVAMQDSTTDPKTGVSSPGIRVEKKYILSSVLRQ